MAPGAAGGGGGRCGAVRGGAALGSLQTLPEPPPLGWARLGWAGLRGCSGAGSRAGPAPPGRPGPAGPAPAPGADPDGRNRHGSRGGRSGALPAGAPWGHRMFRPLRTVPPMTPGLQHPPANSTVVQGVYNLEFADGDGRKRAMDLSSCLRRCKVPR
ncbi:collagen alpha-1(I) chain-like [Ornithorhynchus anatinus]|uniref:collagen alpha-1(I) chain-like n=1 Tax=Ornithorhynchus anatinus TaxID=9258 RepID=UPI0010A75122|nr:collagen alpha-1(I) chain-like [Ornithorhynchus anatinus]